MPSGYERSPDYGDPKIPFPFFKILLALIILIIAILVRYHFL